jgi:hypothetical protein
LVAEEHTKARVALDTDRRNADQESRSVVSHKRSIHQMKIPGPGDSVPRPGGVFRYALPTFYRRRDFSSAADRFRSAR